MGVLMRCLKGILLITRQIEAWLGPAGLDCRYAMRWPHQGQRFWLGGRTGNKGAYQVWEVYRLEHALDCNFVKRRDLPSKGTRKGEVGGEGLVEWKVRSESDVIVDGDENGNTS